MAGNLGAALPLAASVARAVPLAAGQATLATVQGDAQSGFSVQLAGRSIALPPEGSWSAGQQVQLRATVEAGVLRVDVTALSSPTPPDAPGSLSRLVAALLPSLGLSLSADDAVAVLPGAPRFEGIDVVVAGHDMKAQFPLLQFQHPLAAPDEFCPALP